MRIVFLFLAIVAASLCCRENGEEFKDGQTWISGPFLKKCTQHTNVVNVGWQIDILACLTEDRTQVPIGTSVSLGNTIYSCDKLPSGQAHLTRRSKTIAKLRAPSINDLLGNGNFFVPPMRSQ